MGAEKRGGMDGGRAVDMGGREKVEGQVENQRKYGTTNKKSRSVESSLGSSTFRRVGEICLMADRMNAFQRRRVLRPEYSVRCSGEPRYFAGSALVSSAARMQHSVQPH